MVFLIVIILTILFFGKEIVDDENEKNNIKYTKARERVDTVNWDLAFDDLISVSKENKSIEYRPEYTHADFMLIFHIY